MSLPLAFPYEPMEAESVASLPTGPEWLYEPKWDGFRCLAFRDGETVRIQSKAGKPLERYFPDVVEAVRHLRPTRFVLDGEIVIPVDGHLSFDELLLRVHPAESRVRTLVEAHRARLIAFDLLVDERGKSLVNLPLAERRRRLDGFAKTYFPRRGGIVLSKPTRRLATAQSWLASGGGGDLDGVIAKRVDLAYRSGERDGMVKVKRQRTADCVWAAFVMPRRASGSSVRCSSGYMMAKDSCITSASAPVSERRSGPSSRQSWSGWSSRPALPARRRADRAGGARSGRRSGSRSRRNSWWRWRTIIFRAAGFATGRSSCGGGPTRRRRSVRWISFVRGLEIKA
jgi:hypothetical protein